MTRDEIVAQVKLLMGFRTDMTNVVAAQVAIQQNHLERDVEWQIYPHFLLTEISNTTTVAEEQRLEKPDDWIADCEEDGLWILDDEDAWHLLTKTEFNKLQLEFKNCEPGLPTKYATLGDYYYLGVAPDAVYTVNQVYYQRDEVISDGSGENRWMRYAPNLLIGRVGLFLCGASNSVMRDMFSAMYQESKKAVERKSFDELTVNRQYALGENM